ncbi:uncharacterized protein [Magallana gigas]|uniref:uncharacterized protein n=1 Tax=Magallana gigas TaxID=29159 RepID=UPI00334135EB
MKTRLIAAVFFIFYTGTVQNCTIVIKNHGMEIKESTSYWDDVGYTLTSCEAACQSDSSCFGYSFDSDSGICAKSKETGTKNANSCPTCSFHSKRCGLDCSVTYTSYGNDKASENPYSTSTKSYPECETSCSSDQNCTGFGYDSSTNQCTLTEINIVEVAEYTCTTCTFSLKVCNGSIGGITATQNVITELTTLTNVVTTVNEISTTPDVTPDVIKTTERTTASKTETETSQSILTSMEDTTANDQITTLTSAESTKTTTAFTSPESTTTTTSFTSSESTTTTAFTSPESTTTTTAFTSPESITTTTTPFTSPEPRTTKTTFTSPESTITTIIPRPFPTMNQDTTSEIITTTLETDSVETTTNLDNTSSMSIYFTENNDVNGSSNLCVCHCVYDNMTSLKMRIEERKNTLKMSKDDLSSFHRRLNCAYDPRNSSKVVGGVGILVLTLILSLIIIPDILTTASRLTRKRKLKKT